MKMRESGGRNGRDDLYKATVIAALLLIIIGLLIRLWLLLFIAAALAGYAAFRCNSRDIYARQLENKKFLRLTEKPRKKLAMRQTVLTDKEHYYKKCAKCRTYLRLPRDKGEHTAVCPVCGEKMTVKIK